MITSVCGDTLSKFRWYHGQQLTAYFSKLNINASSYKNWHRIYKKDKLKECLWQNDRIYAVSEFEKSIKKHTLYLILANAVVLRWWLAKLHHAAFSLPLLSSPREENMTEKKPSWVEIRTGKSLSKCCHGQNRLNVSEINVIYCLLLTD